MGYFSNGTEGECYQRTYCFNCVNRKKDDAGVGCPIWDLHMSYNYELCNSKSKAKKMLDFLIPPDKETCGNKQCSMFIDKRKGRKR